MQASMSQGIGALWRGFKLLQRRELLPFVWIPLFINILLFAGLSYLGFHEANRFIYYLIGLLPSWLEWLRWLLWILAVITGLVIMVYSFTFIANLIGAPFNGLLAEKIEFLLTGYQSPDNPWLTFLKSIPMAFKQQARALLYYLPRAILCIVLFFIPVIQIAAAIIWLLFNAWCIALQYLSYPMENHFLPFSKTRQYAKQHWSISMSFGLTVTIISMIPLLNLLIMPVAVAGATILWVEKYKLSK